MKAFVHPRVQVPKNIDRTRHASCASPWDAWTVPPSRPKHAACRYMGPFGIEEGRLMLRDPKEHADHADVVLLWLCPIVRLRDYMRYHSNRNKIGAPGYAPPRHLALMMHAGLQLQCLAVPT